MLRSVELVAHVLSLLLIHIHTSIGQVSQVSQECSERGIQLDSSQGTIQSPNYPFLYPHNIKCIWNITVPARHVVRVTMATLDISTIRDLFCNRAGFTAHDGPLSTSYIMLKACGKRARFVFYSSTRHILLEFKSDSSRSTGFQADFTAVPDKPECSADVRRLSATNRKSDLVTPHFPALYPTNQMCTWMITAPPNHVVMLRVLYFDMEASVSCGRDYFVVRDGADSTGPLLAKMCSQAKQCPLSSSGRYLWIQFKSNERWIFNGIRATYSAVRKEVTNGGPGPVESLQDQGQLTASNSIAIKNPVPTACIWNISVPHGMLVRITLDINVHGFAVNCSAGYVDVFDGPRLSSPRIARHCSNALEQTDLPRLTSSGRYVTVRLVLGSTGYGERVDLKANFKYIAKNTSGCSPSSLTNVTSRNHVISSSYHPKYYPNNEDCKWRIVAPPGKIIQFKFLVCDVVYPGDYVETRDGPTRSDRLIGLSIQPPKIGQYLTTTGRFLWVRFVSDQEKTASGFALDFNFIDKVITERPKIYNNTTSPPTTNQLFNKTDPNKTAASFSETQPAPDPVGLLVGVGLGSSLLVLFLIGLSLYLIMKRKARNKTSRLSVVEYTADQWEIRAHQVVLLDELGNGAFGKVSVGKLDRELADNLKRYSTQTKLSPRTNEPRIPDENAKDVMVAVKMLHSDSTVEEQREFLKEIELMKSVGCHRNIVSMVACCTKEEPAFLVVEFAKHGDLLNLLRQKRLKFFPGINWKCEESASGEDDGPLGDVNTLLKDLMSFSWQIAQGMEYLTSKGIVHRDLAARNILVGDDDIVKVADFGLSRHVTYEDQIYQASGNRKLPIKWMSPEAIYDQTFTAKSDVWSYGVVLWEIYSMGGSPYPTITNRQLVQWLRNGHRMDKPVLCPGDMFKIMQSCWLESPENRPTFTTIKHDTERLMSEDNPYVEFRGIDESSDYYLNPFIGSDADSDESML